jgi:HD-GYP domain-containing protein (c-di-GMP phosphodiesterase class II)
VIGPVVVLLAFGDHRFHWSDIPVYGLALLAQIVLDFSSSSVRQRLGEGFAIRQQTLLGWAYLTDLALSCVGLFVAASAVHNPWTLLAILPLIGLLALFARERTQRLEGTLTLGQADRGTAMLLVDVIEGDDQYTGSHSRSVVGLSVAVAERLGLNAQQRQEVEFGALLHDVGKIRVPKAILHKPGPLDPEEWREMQRHTAYGEAMLRPLGGVLSRVARLVRASHERWDGKGYPDGLAGEAIPVESRIISVCDAWSAMTTDRPYRKAMSVELAATELRRCAGSHFDPAAVDALLSELALDHLAAAEQRLPPQGVHESQAGASVKHVRWPQRSLALHRGH